VHLVVQDANNPPNSIQTMSAERLALGPLVTNVHVNIHFFVEKTFETPMVQKLSSWNRITDYHVSF
jgi:hypothetical protein